MARARKSHVTNEEKAKAQFRSLNIQPPWSTHLNGNPYVVYADYPKFPPYKRTLVLKFGQLYSAKYFIKLILGNDEYKWVKHPHVRDQAILTEKGIYISMYGQHLRQIMDYEMTEEEAAWKDEQTHRSAMKLKYSNRWEREDDVPGFEHQGENDNDDQESDEGDPSSDPRPRRAKARVDTSGFLTANDIAAQLGVRGIEVRGVLRRKFTKPPQGWSWPKAEAESIALQVKKELKK